MLHRVAQAHALPRKCCSCVTNVAAEMSESMLEGAPLLLQEQAEVLSAEGCGTVVPWPLEAGAVPVAPVHTQTDCSETPLVRLIAAPGDPFWASEVYYVRKVSKPESRLQ